MTISGLNDRIRFSTTRRIYRIFTAILVDILRPTMPAYIKLLAKVTTWLLDLG